MVLLKKHVYSPREEPAIQSLPLGENLLSSLLPLEKNLLSKPKGGWI